MSKKNGKGAEYGGPRLRAEIPHLEQYQKKINTALLLLLSLN